MPKALETRAEIDAHLQAARAELIVAEDTLDEDRALLARTRIDELLERLFTMRAAS
jgi:hypothetical protein